MTQVVKPKPLHQIAVVVIHRAVLRYAEHAGFDRSRAQVGRHKHISHTRDSPLTGSEDPIRGGSVRSLPLPSLKETTEQRSESDGRLGLFRLETFRNLAVDERTP